MGILPEEVNNTQDCTINHSIHQNLSPVIYILVFVVGLPANCLSLYYAYLQVKVKNELGIYLCNLTIADLLYIFSLPFWLQYVLQHDNWTYNELLCKICGILLYENIYISVGFLCCISIDRYLALVHPFRFQQCRTMKAAIVVSAVIWTKEMVTCWLVFKHGEVSKDSESHLVCFEHYPIKNWEHNVNFYRFTAGFLFPFCLLIFSYYGILRVVRKSHGTQKKRKIQIKRLVSSTILIFLICFGPYHVLLLIRSLFEKSCEFAARIFNIYHISLLLTTFNCVADPILYCFSSENTYQDFAKIGGSCLKCLRCIPTENKESYPLNTPETRKKASEQADLNTGLVK
ncbi:ovarian cancer G-protein coupled receptor 1 [Notechis scutatus]|uniref:Ovarian cancer G-protein coupled receptor 1 n=1 Tax=Notechis scutatus TaxID=8663 RepID=A0A6J1UVH7_9SAUR|nr:ovarian cancer G-protein coupled receptor 1 [Notechis scutatus]XP_026534972.1 ovarian cancer G-protein coupled receptor 1 [Notechis scutatus]XP_026534973.1 ovarian cancer G-protein coupled receptor 1 [Notechis scutatus]